MAPVGANPPSDLLGWNEHGTRIIRELDQNVASGSAIVVEAELGEHTADIASECAVLENAQLRSESSRKSDRAVLAARGW